MKAADRAVLSTVEKHLLRADVIDAAIDRALDRLLSARNERQERRAHLLARLEIVETEARRLTDALAAGVAIAPITDALGAREIERTRIQAEMAALNVVPSLDAPDRARIRADLEALMEDWRDLLAEHAVKTRKILRKLLTKRIRFIRETRDGVRGYRLEAGGTLQPFFGELAHGVISRAGTDGAYVQKGVVCETVASPMPGSWNQVASWLKRIKALREAA